MRTSERGSDRLNDHDTRRYVPRRWLHEGMLAAVSLGFVGVGAFMLVQLTRSDLPLVGRVSGAAFVVMQLLAILSLWPVTRTFRRAGEPDDWRRISRETDEGRAFWIARRRSLVLFALAAALLATFVALALSGVLGGYSPLWKRT